ncbi:MAG: glycosyltransferase [Rhizobiaceae bacterium]
MTETASEASRPLTRTAGILFRARASRLIRRLLAARRLGRRLLAAARGNWPRSADSDDYRTIAASGLFDPDWYIAAYPDVRAAKTDPLLHYLAAGADEGRNPSRYFDTRFYVEQYPDVGRSGVNALLHYLQTGRFEGRRTCPATDTATSGAEYQAISSSPLFNREWYLDTYNDVKTNGIDPVVHYLTAGAAQGFDPSLYFSTSYYLKRYPDVGEAGLNPLVHYLTYGEIERRQPSDPNSFDDVASAQWKAKLRAHTASSQIMAENPKISVIMPTKDRKTRIVDAIESVRRQTYAHWELIVVDDHSSDGTSSFLTREFAHDDRIQIVANYGQGVGDARNVGLKRATGAFIAYLDSDNRWYEDYLELMICAIERDQCDCAYAVQKCYRVPFVEERSSIFYRNNVFDYEHLKLYNYIDLNIFVHRASLVSELGRFDTSLRRMVDWDLVIRYCKGRHVTKADFIGVKYDAGPSKDRISNKENRSYLYAVRNKHLVDWEALQSRTAERDANLVSIVMCVHSVADLTDECLKSLFLHEAGEPFELVLVDNASDEETRTLLLEWSRRHDNIRLIRNPENFNFALGNNIGFAATQGSRIVFLNNDTLVSPEWLRALVSPLDDPKIKGAQPKLVYPDGTIQCVGIVFSSYSPFGYPIHAKRPGNFPPTAAPRNYRAVTGAAFAIRAADFAGAKGFDPVFVNGQEDVDLCLRIGDGDAIFRYVPDSVVIHHESRTPGRGQHIEHNRSEFARRWHKAFEADDAKYYAADHTPVDGYEPDDPNWVDRGLAAWAPRLSDTANEGSAEFAALFQGATIAIKIGCPRPDMKDHWGDYHFAVGLAAAFHRRGVGSRIDFLQSWPTSAAAGDINLVLRGLSKFGPAPDTINLMWMISHPDKVANDELDAFDHVFVASTAWALELARACRTPVEPLLQCTDPGRFNPGAYDPAKRRRALFVANSRKVMRPVVAEARREGVKIDIFGEMWDGLAPPEWIHGENIPNAELPRYYASADIVLNDHWPSMKERGFMSNRIFDVLACGGSLVTDSVAGMPVEIENACRFFDRDKSLASLVSSAPQRTGRLGKAAKSVAEMIHRKHSFDARAETILARLAELLSARVT